MKPAPEDRLEAFTRLELMVVVVVAFVLLTIFLPFAPHATAIAPRIECINHLKEIGAAYRIWSSDHGDRYPALQSNLGRWQRSTG